MGSFRARSCPKCHYFVAFAVSQPPAKPKESTVASFCLNCGYKIPVHKLVRGMRRGSSPVRRRLLRLAKAQRPDPARANAESSQTDRREPPIDPSEYSRHLRAIGKD